MMNLVSAEIRQKLSEGGKMKWKKFSEAELLFPGFVAVHEASKQDPNTLLSSECSRYLILMQR